MHFFKYEGKIIIIYMLYLRGGNLDKPENETWLIDAKIINWYTQPNNFEY